MVVNPQSLHNPFCRESKTLSIIIDDCQDKSATVLEDVTSYVPDGPKEPLGSDSSDEEGIETDGLGALEAVTKAMDALKKRSSQEEREGLHQKLLAEVGRKTAAGESPVGKSPVSKSPIDKMRDLIGQVQDHSLRSQLLKVMRSLKS